MLLKIKKTQLIRFCFSQQRVWTRGCHACVTLAVCHIERQTCKWGHVHATAHSFIRSEFFWARLIRWNKCLSLVHFCSLSLTSFKSYNLDSLDSYLVEELHLFNMSAKAIYETDGKSLLAKWFQNSNYTKNKFAVVVHDTDWDVTLRENPWLETEVSLNLLNLNLWFK